MKKEEEEEEKVGRRRKEEKKKGEGGWVGGWQVFAADGGGAVVYDEVDWGRPSVLLVGNEGNGLSEEVRGLVVGGGGGGGGGGLGGMQVVSIPLGGGIESLNAAAAGAMLMGEVARQRRRGRE